MKSHHTFILVILLCVGSSTQIHAQADSARGKIFEISDRKDQFVLLDTTPSYDDTLVQIALSDSGTNFKFYRDTANLHLLDTMTAIAVAEAILFNVYGTENILMQRPYSVNRSGHYWVMTGSLPQGHTRGGTFLIILDARDARIIELSHGK